MKTRSFCLAFLACVALPLSTQAAPQLNTPCKIELRRDATGPNSTSGTRIEFEGKLKNIDQDWICIDAGEQGEVWIPVSSVQFIQFTPPKS